MQAILFRCYQTVLIFLFVLIHIRITKIIERRNPTILFCFVSASFLIYGVGMFYLVLGNRRNVYGGVEVHIFRGLMACAGLVVEVIKSITVFAVKGIWCGISNCDYYFARLNESASNVILYMPLGYLIPCLSGSKRHGLLRIAWIGLSISLSFELIQLITKLGKFDMDDLINNTLGATVGYILYFKANVRYRHNESTST